MRTGKLAPHFLAVLNTEADDEGQAIIRHGNERVLRARFKDARFFWEFDQRTPLAERVESLKNVTFQKELGSYYWKTEAEPGSRRAACRSLRRRQGLQHDERALMTAVRAGEDGSDDGTGEGVYGAAGVIGGLYARAQGLGERVALAIYDQYPPASMEDAIPVRSREAAGDCGSHPDDRGDVRAGIAADGIEGSVCAAARGECDCEDSGGVGLAADVERCGALGVDG